MIERLLTAYQEGLLSIEQLREPRSHTGSVGPFRLVLRCPSYDCLQEMPKSKRFLTWASILWQR